MLNSVIRVDLHIHSKASAYRENSYSDTGENIVEYSDVDHLHVLLDKLKSDEEPEKRIDLFSITDHDRFDVNLYERIVEELKSEKYGRFATVLPGVEFTVLLEEGKEPAHVVTIFDVGMDCWADGWFKRLRPIADSIMQEGFIRQGDSFSFNRFIELLSNIGYRAILIAHQFDGLTISTSRPSSLSRATSHPEEYLTYGVFDALEYTRTKVEGILLHELKEQNLPTSMVAGSDCHDWRCYPHHDRVRQGNKDRFNTDIKCLPTFRGLLCAFTSPDTRLRSSEFSPTRKHVESVFVGGEEILLSPGINAIIGENGSGKSTLLDVMGSEPISEKWRDRFIREHELNSPTALGRGEALYVKQGALVTQYGQGEGSLFEEALFPSIPTSNDQQFATAVRRYTDGLKVYVTEGIARHERRDKLKNTQEDLMLGKNLSTHALEAVLDNDFSRLVDPFSVHASQLAQAVKIICDEAGVGGNVYTSDQVETLLTAAHMVDSVRTDIQRKSDAAQLDTAAKGVVQRALKAYSDMVQNHRTTADNKKLETKAARRNLVNAVLDVAKDEAQPRMLPLPIVIDEGLGIKSVPSGGFEFSSEANYHSMANITEGIISKLFNRDYRNNAALEKIDTLDTLEDAVSGGRGTPWDERWNSHVSAFIETCEKVTTSIGAEPGASVGGTLGEQSLAYYKYQSNNAAEGKPILIDQPEDNISNSSIVSDLVDDLSALRNSRQVILVTHNPLLVVNLDVDNVIVLEREGEKLKAHGGCLESTDDGDILDMVANHMDGGRDAIRKRLKLYGQHQSQRTNSN